MALFGWGKKKQTEKPRTPRNPRTLREAAFEALHKRKHAQALECYLELERLEPQDPEWPRRAADCFRSLGRNNDAVEALSRAAERYAASGFLVKAVAMCRVILNLDPSHQRTQLRLSELYAAQSGRGAPVRATSPKAAPPPNRPVPPTTTAPAQPSPPPRATASPARPVTPNAGPRPPPPQPVTPDAGPRPPPPQPVTPDAGPRPPPPPKAAAIARPVTPPEAAAPRPPPPEAPTPARHAPNHRLAPPARVPHTKTAAEPPSETREPLANQHIEEIQVNQFVPGSRQSISPKGKPSGVFEIPLEIDSPFEHDEAPSVTSTSGEASIPKSPNVPQSDVSLQASALAPGATSTEPPMPRDGHAPPSARPVAGIGDEHRGGEEHGSRDEHGRGDEDSSHDERKRRDEHGRGDEDTNRDEHGRGDEDSSRDEHQSSGGGEERSAVREAFAKTPLFSELSPDSLTRLIEKVEWVHLERGDTLFNQGDPADGLYVVVEGEVGTYTPDSEKFLTTTFRDGEFFGELGLLSRRPRHATVRALMPTELLMLGPETVAHLINAEPSVMQVLLRFVRDRLIADLVRTSPLFSSFDEDERQALASRFRFLEVDPGALLIERGQPAEGLYVLLTGSLQVISENAESNEELVAGDVFGASSLLENKPASATVQAISKCFALLLPAKDFRTLVITHPPLLEYVSHLAEARSPTPAEPQGSYSKWHLDLL